MNYEERIEAICKKYDLPVKEHARDNFMIIVQSAEPTEEDKAEALEFYDRWLLRLFRVEV